MEWPTIIGGIAVAAVASYWIYVYTRRGKVASRKGDQLISHLRKIGVQASWAGRGTKEQKLGSRPILGRRSEGVIKIEGRNVDYISIMSEINQYPRDKYFYWGARYFFDYVVKSSGWAGGRQNLARGIEIIPERKYGYVKIRTRDTLPSAELFQDIDIIAQRIRSGSKYREEEFEMESAPGVSIQAARRTWKTTAAGFFIRFFWPAIGSIVTGAIFLAIAITLAVILVVEGWQEEVGGIAITIGLIGIIVLVGGIFALKRKT